MSESDINPDQAFTFLRNAVRAMIPSNAGSPVPNPNRANLLAQSPRASHPRCRVCAWPGHQSNNVHKASACRDAIITTIGFWEDVLANVQVSYKGHLPFQMAIQENKVTVNMIYSDAPKAIESGGMEAVIVNRLAMNYLKFQRLWASLGPKVSYIMEGDRDVIRYENITQALNDYLLAKNSYEQIVMKAEPNTR
ncbi:hypothetical protein K469DRAFT_753238 [Zopfia rhizophila CBS 207.26]|uniref:Uncharacterized protein n=1 Tax=Zopfia rhizophila CBS 207.26 TaxID=1314779 RepID=A0A6A6DRF7_9PEZI|nr:hypothetical protein K469DRAFT_753238 [Zopfia rhizophila CBS 207.26]